MAVHQKNASKHTIRLFLNNTTRKQVITNDDNEELVMSDCFILDINYDFCEHVQHLDDERHSEDEIICHCFYSLSSVNTKKSDIILDIPDLQSEFGIPRHTIKINQRHLVSQLAKKDRKKDSKKAKNKDIPNSDGCWLTPRASEVDIRSKLVLPPTDSGPHASLISCNLDKSSEMSARKRRKFCEVQINTNPVEQEIQNGLKLLSHITKSVLYFRSYSYSDFLDLKSKTFPSLKGLFPTVAEQQTPDDIPQILWKRVGESASSHTSVESVTDENVCQPHCGDTDWLLNSVRQIKSAVLTSEDSFRSLLEAGEHLRSCSSCGVLTDESSGYKLHKCPMYRRRKFSRQLLHVLNKYKATQIDGEYLQVMIVQALKQLKTHFHSLYNSMEYVKQCTQDTLDAVRRMSLSYVTPPMEGVDELKSQIQALEVLEKESLVKLQNLDLECTCNVIVLYRPRLLPSVKVFFKKKDGQIKK